VSDVRIGTCSWADKTMVERWYPPEAAGSPERRLRYYARRFDTVEADSPFYGLPKRAVAENWAKRTPPDFVFHVKAYGMMTQHRVDERALHPELREYEYEVVGRGKVHRPSPQMVDRAFEIFRDDVVEPLRAAGKMGGVLMQFPAYFTAEDAERRDANLGWIEHAAEMLPEVRLLVEFRHPSWVSERELPHTLRFLEDRGMSYVSVDAPQFPDQATMPPIAAATSPIGYVRLHGRNRDTYFQLTKSAADRFDYLYTPEELEEWREPVARLAEVTDETFVMFNNCKYDYAPRNAHEMAEILGDVVHRHGGAEPGDPSPESGSPEHRPPGDDSEHVEQLGFEL